MSKEQSAKRSGRLGDVIDRVEEVTDPNRDRYLDFLRVAAEPA